MSESRINEELREYSWAEHLQEFRVRLIYILVIFICSLISGLFFAKPIFHFIQKSSFIQESVNWNVFHPADVFSIYVKFALLFSLFITIPGILYHLGRYLGPALYVNEKKKILIFIPSSLFLFALGVLFTYYIILPFAFSFISFLNSDFGFQETYGVNQFFTFIFNVILAIVLIFQIPIVLIYLTSIGLLNPTILRKSRKHAYFILIFLAAVITPPDLALHTVVTIPLILLYEVSVLICSAVYKRYLKQKQQYIGAITIQKE